MKKPPTLSPETIELAFKALEARGMIYYTPEGVYVPEKGRWKPLLPIVVEEEILAYGHPAITATHRTTLGITKAHEIGKEADCIIGVRANKACADLKEEVKNGLKAGKKVEMSVEVERIKDRLVAHGSPALTLESHEEIVVRKSDFIDARTLAILADKAAADLERRLVEKLKSKDVKIKIILKVIG
jgi:hypothetical protein